MSIIKHVFKIYQVAVCPKDLKNFKVVKSYFVYDKREEDYYKQLEEEMQAAQEQGEDNEEEDNESESSEERTPINIHQPRPVIARSFLGQSDLSYLPEWEMESRRQENEDGTHVENKERRLDNEQNRNIRPSLTDSIHFNASNNYDTLSPVRNKPQALDPSFFQSHSYLESEDKPSRSGNSATKQGSTSQRNTLPPLLQSPIRREARNLGNEIPPKIANDGKRKKTLKQIEEEQEHHHQ